MTHGKSVTILLAAYKGNEFAGAQIDSILAQTGQDWFLVLSDDGEDTAALLDGYAAAHPERILHYRAGRRFGSSQAHFSHLIRTFGDAAPYTMCCDQDDVWHPDKVEKTLAAMRRAEAETGADVPLLVHTDLRVVDGDLNPVAPSFTAFSKLDGNRLAFHELLVQNVVTGCTMMMNRALAAFVPAEGEAPEMMMHDWWLALAAAAFGRAVYLPEATIDYRQHGANVVGAKDAGSLAYMKSRAVGRYMRDMRDKTIAQTKAFLRCYGDRMRPEDRETAEAFVSLEKSGKLRRIRTLSRYDLWKNTLPRKTGQLIGW